MNKRLISIVIVAVGMIAGAVLVSNQQNINEEASELAGAGSLELESVQEGDSVTQIKLNFSTGMQESKPIKISSLSTRLRYPGDITNKIIETEEGPFQPVDGLNEHWEFVVNEVYFDDGVTYLDLVAVHKNTSGYSTNGAQEEFAVIKLTEGGIGTDDFSILGWDEDHAKMMTKESPVEDILQNINKK